MSITTTTAIETTVIESPKTLGAGADEIARDATCDAIDVITEKKAA